MYKAIERFKDLQDDNHQYEVGDKFPREGFEVSEERLNELASDANARGRAVIRKVNNKRKKNARRTVQGTE